MHRRFVVFETPGQLKDRLTEAAWPEVAKISRSGIELLHRRVAQLADAHREEEHYQLLPQGLCENLALA